jgi:hypothetical protein
MSGESGMRVKPDSLLTEQIPNHRERCDAHDGAAADQFTQEPHIRTPPPSGIVLLQPRFRSVQICKDLEVVGIADLLACISRKRTRSSDDPVALGALAPWDDLGIGLAGV